MHVTPLLIGGGISVVIGMFFALMNLQAPGLFPPPPPMPYFGMTVGEVKSITREYTRILEEYDRKSRNKYIRAWIGMGIFLCGIVCILSSMALYQ